MLRKLLAIAFVATLTLSTTAWGGTPWDVDANGNVQSTHAPDEGFTTNITIGDDGTNPYVVTIGGDDVQTADLTVTGDADKNLTITTGTLWINAGSVTAGDGDATSAGGDATLHVRGDFGLTQGGKLLLSTNLGSAATNITGVATFNVAGNATISNGYVALVNSATSTDGVAAMFINGALNVSGTADINIVNLSAAGSNAGGIEAATMNMTGGVINVFNGAVATDATPITDEASALQVVGGGYTSAVGVAAYQGANGVTIRNDAKMSGGVINIVSASSDPAGEAFVDIGRNFAMTGGTINIGYNGAAGDVVAETSNLVVTGTATLSGGVINAVANGDNTPATLSATSTAGNFVLNGSHISNIGASSVMGTTDVNYAGYGIDMSGNAHINLLASGNRITLADNYAASLAAGKATGINIAGGATLAVGTSVPTATGFVDLNLVGFNNPATITAGNIADNFVLGKDAILDLSYGDLTLIDFATDGTITTDTIALNGTILFGGDGTAITNATTAQLTAAGALVLGSTADIRFTGTLMQAMNVAVDGTAQDATSVMLIDGTDTVADYSNVNGSTVQTLVGAYTLGLGNGAGLGNDAGELFVTNVANAVDFRVDATDAAATLVEVNKFGQNAVALGYGDYLNSNWLANAFGVAANESGIAGGTTLGEAARITIDFANASAGSLYNYHYFKAVTNGDGYNYNYDTEYDADGKPLNSSPTFETARGTREAFVGANVGKVNAVNRDVAMGMLDAINGRFLQLRVGLPENCPPANRIWVGALGHWQNGDSRNGFAGYDYDGYGMMLGYDHAFGPLTVGASFGFEKGDYEDDAHSSEDSDIDSYSFNLYALYRHQSGFFGSLAGGYTLSDNDLSYRTGGGSWKEDYDTDTWYIEGKIGYDWKPANGFRLSPSIGLGYISAESEAHKLHNKSINDWTVRYNDQKTDTAYLPIDLELAYDWCLANGSTFSASVNGGYTYNFDDDEIDGTVFHNNQGVPGLLNTRVMAPTYGHHTWNVGAGLKYSGAKWEVGAKYDYFNRADTDAHRLYGYVGFKF